MKKPLEKLPFPKLKKEAWKVFSRFIRERDKVCFTCKKGKAQNAGHWRHGHNKIGFLDEENVHGQCVRCNLWLSGNQQVYTLKMVSIYGEEETNKMWKYFNKDHNFTRKELIGVIKKYS